MRFTSYENKRWATLSEAAHYCGLTERTIYNLIGDGLIRSSLVKRLNASRGRRLVDLYSLDAWIEKGLMQVGPPPSNPNQEPRTKEEES
ncbi:MAG: helix-turn-helix domain-containing protein [Akkermansiaceae bacterium]|nr:helix-turn-helix domain-containing protein [Akkermansiaceae bacterium]